ncbi:MAG: AsnC family transcriptional regulator [Candidatus Micrarchaeales archaeon]|nr:AsnC family transcriptional regulator [Candidatus Micrarchaeales archaeon]
MQKIPEEVILTYNKLKKEFPFYISLKNIRGKYYLYKQTSHFEKDKKKLSVKTFYIGRILHNGTFLKKGVSSEVELENAKAVIISYGGKVILPKENEFNESTTIREILLEKIDQEILKALSMNGRATLNSIGKQIGLTESSTYNRLKILEKKYGITYIPEIVTEKVGYLKYIAFVKFLDEVPSLDELKSAFENQGRIQFVLLTKGIYDLVIYFLAEGNIDAGNFLPQLRDSDSIIKYPARWYVTPYFNSYGYVPLRDQFYELLEHKVWRRSKENPRPSQGQIMNRDYQILSKLNKNGAEEFSKIGKSLGLESNAIRYGYLKLLEKGIVRRVTINLKNLPIRSTGIVIIEILDRVEFAKTRAHLLSDIIKETELPINAYSLVGDIAMPQGIMYILPTFKDNELEMITDLFKRELKGIKINSLAVIGIVIGSLGYRLYNNSQSEQRKVLKEVYKF